MTSKYFTLFITMVMFLNNAFGSEGGHKYLLVKTKDGQVRGRNATSFTGKHYASFEGIPYARPPVGNRRFKAPQPAEPWRGVLNATAPGQDCPQLLSGDVVGHEDCLTLNVYTTQLSGHPKPVLVWIHGGSFINGSSRLYQPDVLLEQQLVVVTLNYRLGPFGFLCWPEAGIHGNMGLRDQSLALQWVQHNIAAFGGDANCVTLAGHSAGAASVTLHMMSPLSKGLFHRALCMSGSALCRWATRDKPHFHTRRLLRAAGLTRGVEGDAAAMAAFLNSSGADPSVLVPLYREALDPKERLEDMLPILSACVEKEGGPSAFLPDKPWRLMLKGLYERMPVLAGITDGEAKFFLLYGGLGSKESLQALDGNFEHVFPSIRDPKLIARIRNYYFGSEPITEKMLVNVTNMLADFHMVEPMDRTAVVVGMRMPLTFFYLLTHQPRHSFWGTPVDVIERLGVPGVPHGEDLWALFPLLVGEPPANQRVPEDDWVRLYFATAVGNFARTGRPVPETDYLMTKEWLSFDFMEHAFMNISSRPEIQQDLMADRIAFWRSILADMAAGRGKEDHPQRQSNQAAVSSQLQFFLTTLLSSLILAVFLP